MKSGLLKRIGSYVAGTAAAAMIYSGAAKGVEHFSDANRGATNLNNRIGFVTNWFRFDETGAKVTNDDELAVWVKDYPSNASNSFITGHTENQLHGNISPTNIFTIPTGLYQSLPYINGEGGTVYVTANNSLGNYKHPFGVLFWDASQNKELHTKLRGENNTLNTIDFFYSHDYGGGTYSTNRTTACNEPHWNAMTYRYTYHTNPNGTNTITLETHYMPLDRTSETNSGNSIKVSTNYFVLGDDTGDNWNSFKRGDEIGFQIQDPVNTDIWHLVDRRVLQTTPNAGDRFMFIATHVIPNGTTNVNLGVGASIYSIENGGGMRLFTEGLGNSSNSSTHTFLADGRIQRTTAKNTYQTNDFVIPDTDGHFHMIPEGSGLVPLVLGGVALARRRKGWIEREWKAQQNGLKYK